MKRKEVVEVYFERVSRDFHGETGKTPENISQDSRYPTRDLIWAFSENKSQALPIKSACSVILNIDSALSVKYSEYY
jgi:hypothetical protein